MLVDLLQDALIQTKNGGVFWHLLPKNMKQPEEHLSTSRHLRVFKAKDDVEREAGDWVLILDTDAM